MNWSDIINKEKTPSHVAVIMDGNGRWAKKKGAARIFGHHNAIKAVRETTEIAAEIGVKYLTLYAFSTENWSRPQDEVKGLMELLVNTIAGEVPTLQKNNIKLFSIGNREDLPKKCIIQLEKAIEETSKNTGMTLNLALSYSGRWEITNAMKLIAQDLQSEKLKATEINEDLISSYMQTASIPDPELLIRTSGEMRISNFLLWQIAYTELHITEVLWPDFRKEHFIDAIKDYQNRERRFGKTSEQISL